MSSKFRIPTETVELPSKGLLYPEGSPLSSGTLEMKYMTAKEEDILTNSNYIQQGIVIDKLLESLIVTEGVNFQEILTGDKNAVMIAARILSYGKDYQVNYRGKDVVVDLSEIDSKPIDQELYKNGNKFTFELPKSKNIITFKILTQADEKDIEKEQQGLKKIDKDSSTEVTTRLKFIITAVNGEESNKDIRDFVDNYLLASDARALREEYARVSPDIDLTFKYDNNGVEEDVDLPIGLDFFWPDIKG